MPTKRSTPRATKLRAWRLARGLSQIEAADLTGMTQAAWSRLESGARGAPPLTRVRIARQLGARVADLFDLDEPPVPVRVRLTEPRAAHA